MTKVEVRQASGKKSWNVLIDGTIAFTEPTKESATARAVIVACAKAPSTLATYQANGKVDDGFPVTLPGPPPPPPPPPQPAISRVHLVPGNAEIAPGGTVTFTTELIMSDGAVVSAPNEDFDWIEDEEFLDLLGAGVFEAAENAPDGFPLTVRAAHRVSGLEDVAYLHVVAPPPAVDYTLAGRRIAASATSAQVGDTVALDITPVNAAGATIPEDKLPSDWRAPFYFDSSDRAALFIHNKDGSPADRKPNSFPVFVTVKSVPANNPGSIFLQGGGYGLSTLPFTVTGAPAPPTVPPAPLPPAPLVVEVEHITGEIDPMSATDPAPWGPFASLFNKSEIARYVNHMTRFNNGEDVYITNSHYDPEIARVQGEMAMHDGAMIGSQNPSDMPGRGLVYIDQYEQLYALKNKFNTPEQWSTCKKGLVLMVALHGDMDAREHIWFKAGRGTIQDGFGYWNMKSKSSGPRFIADLTEPIRFAHMLKIPYATPPRNGNGKPSSLFKSWHEAYLWRSDVNISLVGADGSMPSPAHGNVEVPFMSLMVVDELFEGYQFMSRNRAWLDTAVRMCQHLLDIWPAGKRTLPYLMSDVKEAPDLCAYAVRPFAIAWQLTGNVEFRDRALMTLGEAPKAFITGSYDKQWNQVFGWARAWSAKRILEGRMWMAVP